MLPKRYWDANAFLGWFNQEDDKQRACDGVLKAAEKGDLQIVTSALTLVEVIKIKGQPRLKREYEERIRSYFENDFIVKRNVDVFVAEFARDLIWQHEFLDPKDAIHVATAIQSKVTTLDTFDKDLIKLDGKIGNPPLRIGIPNLPVQLPLNNENQE